MFRRFGPDYRADPEHTAGITDPAQKDNTLLWPHLQLYNPDLDKCFEKEREEVMVGWEENKAQRMQISCACPNCT